MSKYWLIDLLTSCLLTLGIASTSYAADIDVSIYGKLNLSYNFVDQGVNDWVSNASRLGIKGEYPFRDNYAIIYQLEQQVDVAHGGTNRETLLRNL